MKTILIECPQCRGTLEVNVETGKVVRHWAQKPGKKPADLTALAEEVKRRAAEGLPDIGKVLGDQQRRRDADFERARRKLLEAPPEEAPPGASAP